MHFNPNPVNIEFTTDTLQDVAQNVAQNVAVLVDVRSEEEWNEGHVHGAIFLPITKLCEGCDAATLAKLLPADTVLYTYCKVGLRAKVAALILQNHGYSVRVLEPGYDDLVAAGLPAEVPTLPA